MIDKATAERIKDAADIVEVVGDYVHLVRRGSNYMGLCPFHNERTPSFSVNRARNFCYCFSCHKGGSPVNFIMEKEGIGYQDALRQLARKYGIKIEERELTDAEREAQSKREAMYVANEWAMNKFIHFLHESSEGHDVGMAYLYERRITDEAIRHFKLGYAPERSVLEKMARAEGFNPEILVELGLLGKSQSGQYYDRFRGRVIYPVLNAAGKVVAFGGRDLKGHSPAKYINSPESAIYCKSNELYGLHQARSDMGKQDLCYLVEGYMDVIGMWQSGLQNAIASSGTALTEAQIALIHRFTGKVVLVYDGDAAGIKASMRGIDMLLAQGLDIKVLLLPGGHDPDSFSHTVTPEQYRQYFEQNAVDFLKFKAQVLLKDAADPMRRTEAARSMVKSLGSIADKIKRNIYVQECSKLLNIDEQVLSYQADIYAHKLAEERNARRKGITPPKQSEVSYDAGKEDEEREKVITAAPPSAHLVRLERNLLRLCVRYGMVPFSLVEELRQGAEEVSEEDKCKTVMLLDYVKGELDADNIILSDRQCARMLDELYAMRDDFHRAEEAYSASLLKQREAIFSNEVDKLLNEEMSVSDLEAAERLLQQRLDDKYYHDMFEYASRWPGIRLTSHEDDELRQLASAMIAEPYQLSRYHSKTGNMLSETERLTELVPRAINELRGGLVEKEITEVRRAIATAENEEQQTELLQRLSELQEIRKNFAFCNGERILSTRSK